MSTMVRWFIKSSLVYLGTGFLLGGILLVYKALAHRAVPSQWVTIHVHLLLVGFMVQLVMGVGYWMFPRVKDHWFGERWAAVSWGLLNVGLLLRFISEPYLFGPWRNAAALVTTLSALLQVAAGLLFASGMWPRIKGVMRV
ncbi:MAG: hypothetical protein ACM3ZA_03105 [Bacillota bacterium]